MASTLRLTVWHDLINIDQSSIKSQKEKIREAEQFSKLFMIEVITYKILLILCSTVYRVQCSTLHFICRLNKRLRSCRLINRKSFLIQPKICEFHIIKYCVFPTVEKVLYDITSTGFVSVLLVQANIFGFDQLSWKCWQYAQSSFMLMISISTKQTFYIKNDGIVSGYNYLYSFL